MTSDLAAGSERSLSPADGPGASYAGQGEAIRPDPRRGCHPASARLTEAGERPIGSPPVPQAPCTRTGHTPVPVPHARYTAPCTGQCHGPLPVPRAPRTCQCQGPHAYATCPCPCPCHVAPFTVPMYGHLRREGIVSYVEIVLACFLESDILSFRQTTAPEQRTKRHEEHDERPDAPPLHGHLPRLRLPGVLRYRDLVWCTGPMLGMRRRRLLRERQRRMRPHVLGNLRRSDPRLDKARTPSRARLASGRSAPRARAILPRTYHSGTALMHTARTTGSMHGHYPQGPYSISARAPTRVPHLRAGQIRIRRMIRARSHHARYRTYYVLRSTEHGRRVILRRIARAPGYLTTRRSILSRVVSCYPAPSYPTPRCARPLSRAGAIASEFGLKS